MSEKRKKILFVGDLRPGMNFGAIATSTVLMNLVQAEEGMIIDSRMFSGIRPAESLKPFHLPGLSFDDAEDLAEIKRKERKLQRRKIRRPRLLQWLAALVRPRRKLPNTADEFEQAAAEVSAGRGGFDFDRSLIEQADHVIINGEGSIVHNIHGRKQYRGAARYMIFMAYLAQKMGKPCSIVNHVIDPDSESFKEVIRRVYPGCVHIAVRDEISLSKLRTIGVQDAVYVPDALFAHQVDERVLESRYLNSGKIDFSKPFICIGDSAASPYVQWDIKSFYRQLVSGLRQHCEQIVFIDGRSGATGEFRSLCQELGIFRVTVFNTSFEELAAILGRSRLFISGRWHASILACLSGTPSILFGTDSHKTRALHEMMALPVGFYGIQQLPEHLDTILADCKTLLDNEAKHRSDIAAYAENCRAATQYYQSLTA